MFTKSLPFTAGDVYFSVFSGMTLSTYKHVLFVVTTAKRSLILNLMLTQRLLSLWGVRTDSKFELQLNEPFWEKVKQPGKSFHRGGHLSMDVKNRRK